MILVSVGSTTFPFQRMTTLVEHLANIRPAHETIIFQYGHTPPHFLDRRISAFPFIPHKTLMRYMGQARIIISHGGPATIYQALSFGNIPWVLPREHRYGEHLNDHQKDFAVFMAHHRLIRIITPKTPLSNICTTPSATRPIQKQNRVLFTFLDSLMPRT